MPVLLETLTESVERHKEDHCCDVLEEVNPFLALTLLSRHVYHSASTQRRKVRQRRTQYQLKISLGTLRLNRWSLSTLYQPHIEQVFHHPHPPPSSPEQMFHHPPSTSHTAEPIYVEQVFHHPHLHPPPTSPVAEPVHVEEVFHDSHGWFPNV